MHLFIFIWSFLNFSGILIEMIAKSCSSYFYKNILRDCMSSNTKRRFECAIASPLLALSAVSNFYFFAGDEIGHMFASRTLQGNKQTVLNNGIVKTIFFVENKTNIFFFF